MTRDDLNEIEIQLMEEVVKRRKLGGYSQEAPGLLLLCETQLKIVQHLRESAPRKKK